MHPIDWLVLLITLMGIVTYGIWKTRAIKNTENYLRGDENLRWWAIGLNIMATQASAITFISTPGQAYESGMGFVQFYFGLPIAMVILSIFVLPHYYRLKVYTAYEFLETRFGLPMRTLTAGLFLIQRGLAAGLTIYAPSIVLSQIFGWPLNATIFMMGAFVVLYTVTGGTKAVSVTQTQQMVVMLLGLFLAAGLLITQLPAGIHFGESIALAGALGKMETVNFTFDPDNRYNFWSGMIGAVFLFLSYFGTDQSQVSRYLGGKSLAESRLGLMFNALFKVPMQFLILLVGVLVFVFYQFNAPPLHFNRANITKLAATSGLAAYRDLEKEHQELFQARRAEMVKLLTAIRENQSGDQEVARARLNALTQADAAIRNKAKALIAANVPDASTKDTDYVFLTYILQYMPVGVIGLLLAMIFSAAWSSSSSELNALATTTVVDLYKRSLVRQAPDRHYLLASKGFTILWGLLLLTFALTARLFDNLIQAVNIIGSLFYGVILGVFLVAFFLKAVQGRAMFAATLIGQGLVLLIYYLDLVAFLWLNLIGCLLVMALGWLLEFVLPSPPPGQSPTPRVA